MVSIAKNKGQWKVTCWRSNQVKAPQGWIIDKTRYIYSVIITIHIKWIYTDFQPLWFGTLGSSGSAVFISYSDFQWLSMALVRLLSKCCLDLTPWSNRRSNDFGPLEFKFWTSKSEMENKKSASWLNSKEHGICIDKAQFLLETSTNQQYKFTWLWRLILKTASEVLVSKKFYLIE